MGEGERFFFFFFRETDMAHKQGYVRPSNIGRWVGRYNSNANLNKISVQTKVYTRNAPKLFLKRININEAQKNFWRRQLFEGEGGDDNLFFILL